MFNFFKKRNICFKFRNVLTKQIRIKIKDKERIINTISPNFNALKKFEELSKKNRMFIIIDNSSKEEEEVERFIRKYNLNVIKLIYLSDYYNYSINQTLKENRIDNYVNNLKNIQ